MMSVHVYLKTNIMKESKENTSNDESGKSFEQHRSAIDKALNEKIRSEQGSESIDPESNQGKKRDRKTDVSEKKSGGGKQSSRGD